MENENKEETVGDYNDWREKEIKRLQELAKNTPQPIIQVLDLASLPAKKEETALEIQQQQTAALTTLAEGVNTIAKFIINGGLSSLLSGYARSQGVQSILGGLAANAGRNALDARTMGQNAIEIVEQIEQVFNKYAEVQNSKSTGEQRDPDLHEVVEEDPGTKYKP